MNNPTYTHPAGRGVLRSRYPNLTAIRQEFHRLRAHGPAGDVVTQWVQFCRELLRRDEISSQSCTEAINAGPNTAVETAMDDLEKAVTRLAVWIGQVYITPSITDRDRATVLEPISRRLKKVRKDLGSLP